MIAGLDPEQRLLADSAARFVAGDNGIALRRAIVGSTDGCPPEVWRQVTELGWLGIGHPPERNGVGGGPLETMIIMEALGHAIVALPMLSSVVIGARLLRASGVSALVDDMLDSLVAGKHRVALAASEPTARFDLDDVQTTAVAVDGGYRLEGHKNVVLDGAGADTLIVLARTAGRRRDAAGLALFLVPRTTPGVVVRGYRTYDGRAAADVSLRGVFVDATALLGPNGGAWPLLEDAVDAAVAALCAEAVGAMRGAFELTVEQLQTRRQFGKPIGSFQVLQHRLVDMHVALEESRSLALAAALAMDGLAADRRRLITAAKVQIGRAGKHVAHECVQMHGGMGMADESRIGRYFKSLLAIDTLFGDADFHLGRFPVYADGT